MYFPLLCDCHPLVPLLVEVPEKDVGLLGDDDLLLAGIILGGDVQGVPEKRVLIISRAHLQTDISQQGISQA